MYYPAFMLRRLLFVIIVFALEAYSGLQVMLFIGLNFAQVIYLMKSQPLGSDTKYELFNDLCTLVLSYTILSFTDFVL